MDKLNKDRFQATTQKYHYSEKLVLCWAVIYFRWQSQTADNECHSLLAE